MAAPSHRRDQFRRRRRRALRRSLSLGAAWAVALIGILWLVLAGIAGFAHA